jgi:hypothetical protein
VEGAIVARLPRHRGRSKKLATLLGPRIMHTGTMRYACVVFNRVVTPDGEGRIRQEAVTESPRGTAWVSGLFAVHEACRLELATPFDGDVGSKYIRTWQFMQS